MGPIESGKGMIRDLFIIFATYGGLLVLTLSSVLNLEWSGAASLGTIYLLLIAPFVMGYICLKYSKKKGSSIYHRRIFFGRSLLLCGYANKTWCFTAGCQKNKCLAN